VKPWPDIDRLINSIVSGVTAQQHKVGAPDIEKTLVSIEFQLEKIAMALEQIALKD
jgi:hypothetical protein